MAENLATEIRSFYSLKELSEIIDEQVKQYENLMDEYSQWLGSFLRDSETTNGDQEWLKKLSALQKTLKIDKKSIEKNVKEKGKKPSLPSNVWFTFKDLMLCTSKQGEAEILFEAIEDIKIKIGKLVKVKDSIEDLKKFGLGKDILYIAYVHDGIPEKIVLRYKGEDEISERFQYISEFSVAETQ
jgi:glutamate mutase epsilon subunit